MHLWGRNIGISFSSWRSEYATQLLWMGRDGENESEILLCSSNDSWEGLCSCTVKVTLVPWSTWDVREMLPPRLSTSFLDIVSPIPVPLQLYLFLCWLAILNILKRLGISFSGIPNPVSETVNLSTLTRSNESILKSVLLLTEIVIPKILNTQSLLIKMYWLYKFLTICFQLIKNII